MEITTKPLIVRMTRITTRQELGISENALEKQNPYECNGVSFTNKERNNNEIK